MSTRKQLTMSESLEQMVPIYAAAKADLDTMEKRVKDYNARIKEAMLNANMPEFEVNGIIAKISETPREDFNELRAIEILRAELSPENFSRVVKTREYLDDTAFQDLAFEGKVNAAILQPCRTPLAPTIVLRLSKKKEGK